MSESIARDGEVARGKMTRIIYTPNADDFKLDDLEMIMTIRRPGDPLLQRLRSNYSQLRESFIDLPCQVGVVSYYKELKKISKERLEELDSPSTTYLPLAVLDKMLELKKEDMENPVARNYVDRALNVLRVSLDLSVPNKILGNKFFALGALTSSQFTLSYIREVAKEIQKIVEDSEAQEIFRKIIETMEGIYPNFDYVEEIHKKVLDRSKLNKVSRDFPLFFLPPETSTSAYLVSLDDRIEEPDFFGSIIETIKLGCKASGHDKIPTEVQDWLEEFKKDKFAQTQRADSLESILRELPDPQTVITDIYIADSFPELTERGFEAYEFRLAA